MQDADAILAQATASSGRGDYKGAVAQLLSLVPRQVTLSKGGPPSSPLPSPTVFDTLRSHRRR
jgi:hypothetical protein